MPHFHVLLCHQIVIVWHGSNHTRDLLPMSSLQALVASADNYLDNQNSEGALATGKFFFVKLTKRECKTMQNACSNLSSVQRILKCITKLHKEYRIFKCLDGRVKMNQGSCASGTLFEARQKQSECGMWRNLYSLIFWRWLIWLIDIQNKPAWSCMQWFRNKFFIGWSRYVSSIWPAWLLSCAATIAGAGIFSSLVCTDHHPPLLSLIYNQNGPQNSCSESASVLADLLRYHPTKPHSSHFLSSTWSGVISKPIGLPVILQKAKAFRSSHSICDN